MSAGAFELSKYGASYGNGSNIHPIRIQPETKDAVIDGTANSAPAGANTSPISAAVSRGNRALGLNARMVSLRAPESGQPAGYLASGITRIPALTQAFYDKATKGATCTYQDVSYTVVGVSPERVN